MVPWPGDPRLQIVKAEVDGDTPTIVAILARVRVLCFFVFVRVVCLSRPSPPVVIKAHPVRCDMGDACDDSLDKVLSAFD